MKASEDPRMVAISIHLRSLGAHGEAVSAEPIAVQGGTAGDLETTIVVTVHRCTQIGNVADAAHAPNCIRTLKQLPGKCPIVRRPYFTGGCNLLRPLIELQGTNGAAIHISARTSSLNEIALGSQRKHRLVDIAPSPFLSRFDGTHHRMSRTVKVFCGVLVLGVVAARYITTHQAHAQVHPKISHLNTLLTNMRGRSQKFNLIKMGTFRLHEY
jgi:hypothetical protein